MLICPYPHSSAAYFHFLLLLTAHCLPLTVGLFFPHEIDQTIISTYHPALRHLHACRRAARAHSHRRVSLAQSLSFEIFKERSRYSRVFATRLRRMREATLFSSLLARWPKCL